MRTLLLTVLAALLGSTARAETLYFIHVDHLGTPRLAVGEDMVERWRWDQAEPFGDNPPIEVMGPEGYLVNLPLRFPGQYADKETNLHYNYYRDYDPGIGRYVQSDPIGLLGGINTYAYVSGNPISFTDPTGQLFWLAALPFVGGSSVSLSGAATALAGGAAAFALMVTPGDSQQSESRGQSDPVSGQKPFNPGRDCDGKCNICPPPIYWDALGDAHGSTGGSHWHGIVWNQDPVTCMCYPNRVSGSSPGNVR